MKLSSVLGSIAALLLAAIAPLAATGAKPVQPPGLVAAAGAAQEPPPGAESACAAGLFVTELPALGPASLPLASSSCGPCSVSGCLGGVTGQACTVGFAKGRCIFSPKICFPGRTSQCICSAGL